MKFICRACRCMFSAIQGNLRLSCLIFWFKNSEKSIRKSAIKKHFKRVLGGICPKHSPRYKKPWLYLYRKLVFAIQCVLARNSHFFSSESGSSPALASIHTWHNTWVVTLSSYLIDWKSTNNSFAKKKTYIQWKSIILSTQTTILETTENDIRFCFVLHFICCTE